MLQIPGYSSTPRRIRVRYLVRKKVDVFKVLKCIPHILTEDCRVVVMLMPPNMHLTVLIHRIIMIIIATATPPSKSLTSILDACTNWTIDNLPLTD